MGPTLCGHGEVSTLDLENPYHLLKTKIWSKYLIVLGPKVFSWVKSYSKFVLLCSKSEFSGNKVQGKEIEHLKSNRPYCTPKQSEFGKMARRRSNLWLSAYFLPDVLTTTDYAIWWSRPLVKLMEGLRPNAYTTTYCSALDFFFVFVSLVASLEVTA